MTDEKGFPKYQWSKFVNGREGEQYVVRADDSVELKNAINKVLELIKETTPASDPAQPAPQQTYQANTAVCPIHHVPMVQRFNRTNGASFYACPQRNPYGSYCKARPV